MHINIFKGVIVGYIFTFLSFLIFAIILSNTNLSDTYISGTITVISIISILLGSAFCTKKANSQGLIWGSIVGLIYSLITYLISSIFLVGFNSSMPAIYLILLSTLFGAIGGIVGINLKR